MAFQHAMAIVAAGALGAGVGCVADEAGSDGGATGSTEASTHASGPADGTASRTATSGAASTGDEAATAGSSDSGGSGTRSSSESGEVYVPCGDVVHEGDLVIVDATVPTDVAGITDVTGDVIVEDTGALEDLQVLGNLLCVIGTLRVRFNAGLASLAGLESLRRIGGLDLGWNTNLSDAGALVGLETLGWFRVEANPALTTFPRFADNVSITRDGSITLTIGEGNGFSDLDPLSEIRGLTVDPLGGHLEIRIVHDEALEDVAGIAAFAGTTTEDRITLSDLPALETIDLAGFEQLGSLSIGDVPALANLAAPDLGEVEELVIADLGTITDLQGFSALQTAGDITIGCSDGAPAITDLGGFEGLTSAGRLRVVGLSELTTLSPLSGSLDVARVLLVENAALPQGEAEAFVDAVAPEDGAIVCSNLGDPDPCGEGYGGQVCMFGE